MLPKCFQNFSQWMSRQTSSQIKHRRTIRFTTFQPVWTLLRLVSMQITSPMNSQSSRKSQWQGTWKPWLVSWIKALRFLTTVIAFAMKRVRVGTIAPLSSQDLSPLTFGHFFVKVRVHLDGRRFPETQKTLRERTKRFLIYFQTMNIYIAG